MYKEPRTCFCGYSTLNRGNFSKHKRLCSFLLSEQQSSDKELISTLKEQLEQSKKQLAEKDKQIAELLDAAKDERKKPRTVTHTTNNTVNYNNVNVFGKESLSHITDETIQELIKDPETSIARLVTLKHSVVENRNIRVPNIREQFV